MITHSWAVADNDYWDQSRDNASDSMSSILIALVMHFCINLLICFCFFCIKLLLQSHLEFLQISTSAWSRHSMMYYVNSKSILFFTRFSKLAHLYQHGISNLTLTCRMKSFISAHLAVTVLWNLSLPNNCCTSPDACDAKILVRV